MNTHTHKTDKQIKKSNIKQTYIEFSLHEQTNTKTHDYEYHHTLKILLRNYKLPPN